jgi:hypothetical protein
VARVGWGRSLARTLRVGRGYRLSLERAGVVPGSALARLLVATQNALCAARTLPSPLDSEAAIPPLRTAWVRRVTGKNLWLYYAFDDSHVTVIAVVKQPPVPLF